ncbi:tape measure domain-containing protein [Ochrobactrum daejeonense]|uniref:Tape measure domain-containing protein n=1 Tax=Brucella daejeonensis TaxID=659015 RepID=A0A7W9EJW8_9HYPH|nr:tape measure protein [Brucella daejeonensis]MBB5700679.1 tape measure domain-containing protein [Brucella daejeonensis]
MATNLESLVVQFSADFKRLENAINRQRGQFTRQMRQMEKSADASVQRINAALGNIGKGTMRDLAAPLTGITAALGTRELMQYADAWTQAGNLIRSSATAAGVGARSLNELKDGANEARTSLEAYTDLYARLIRSASAVAKSEDEIALATSLVSKAFKAGGASAQEQAAGILQLGQALGSGVLQGDELRSLRENAPVIAKAIADEFKVSIAGLKQLGADGKLTSDRVFKAILNAQKGIEAQFKATNATIADAFTQINNEFTAYIGNADKSAGASRQLVQALQYVADNFKEIADVVAAFATVLITAFTGRAIAGVVVGLGQAVVALGSFLTALRTGTSVVAAFSASLGPIGLLAGAAAGAVYLLYNNMSSGDRAAKAFSSAINSNEEALKSAASASKAYQAELVKQIGLQLETARATATTADAAFDKLLIKMQALREWGLEFSPLESWAAVAKKEAQAADDAAYRLEKQHKRAQEILASTPSGYGGGIATTPDDKKKGRKKKTPAERFDESLQRVTDRTSALVAETEAQRQINPLINDYGYAMEKARTEQELLNAAQKAGVALTPELRAQIAQTADQWALASAEAAKLAEAQNRIRETAEDMAAFQKDLVGGIANDFINGASAADVFANALGRIAQKLIDIGLANIFDTDKGGFNLFGALGGIFRKNGGPVKRAGGGIVRGPGGPRGDKIPAMLSDEEFVVNAAATKRNRALLEAINSGRVIGLKDGGSPLRAPSMPILRSSAATQQAQAGIADVRVFVDRDGNWQAEVERISQRNVKQGLAVYEKGGAVRAARDLRQVNDRGYTK